MKLIANTILSTFSKNLFSSDIPFKMFAELPMLMSGQDRHKPLKTDERMTQSLTCYTTKGLVRDVCKYTQLMNITAQSTHARFQQ